MADILIRGMEMPKDICGEPGYVDVRIFSDGSVVMAKAAPPYYGKFEAVPLPAGHGRLGDLDALDRAFTSLRFNADGHLAHWDDRRNWCLHGYEIERLIGEAPTIVPAEGGTDDG